MPFQKLENSPTRPMPQTMLSTKLAGSPRRMSMKNGITAKSVR